MSDIDLIGKLGEKSRLRGYDGLGHFVTRMSGTVFASGILADGSSFDVSMAGAPMPCTIAIKPLSGETVTMAYTVDGTNYINRVVASVYAEDVLDAPIIGLRFTASVGNSSTWSICE